MVRKRRGGGLRLKWYLCGPMSGYPDQSYRKKLKSILKKYGHTYYDPTLLERKIFKKRGRVTHKVKMDVVKRDQYAIRTCDALVGFFPVPSDGSASELTYAHDFFIPTVIIIPKERKFPSPFLDVGDVRLKSIDAFDKFLSNKTALKNLICKYISGIV